GARCKCLRAAEPLGETIPIPVAALLGERVGESEAFALADRLSDHAPEVRAQLVRAALVGIVAGQALVEDLLALRQVGLGEIAFDRLLSRCCALTFLSYAGNRKAHFLGAFRVKDLTCNNGRSERDNARKQYPAGNGVEAVVHAFP